MIEKWRSLYYWYLPTSRISQEVRLPLALCSSEIGGRERRGELNWTDGLWLLFAAMKPQEVTTALELNKLKDKIWFVVPSCATTGEGLLEGLVSSLPLCLSRSSGEPRTKTGTQTNRHGSQITSNHPPHKASRNRTKDKISLAYTERGFSLVTD